MIYKIHLDDIDDKELFHIYGNNAPVALVGSGISGWFPSNLPTGMHFTKSVYSYLFEDSHGKCTDPNPKFLNDIFSNLPFEIINERCPNPLGIDNLLRNIYSNGEPNPVHEVLADFLSFRKIKAIITPNYDCCLDKAIFKSFNIHNDEKSREGIRVVKKEDINDLDSTFSPLLFKIHGSIDDFTNESLVFRLNQEGVLPHWKSLLFRNMIRDETLLIIGYSGKDFDICPEIALSNPQKILWNIFNEKEIDDSVNINLLSGLFDIYILLGDMRSLISRLYRPTTAYEGKHNININDLLNNRFTIENKELWKIRIYNSINYNKSAITAIKEALSNTQNTSTQILLLSELAGALASSGKYFDAAKTHDLAAKIAFEKEKSFYSYIEQLLLACDAWRCYGSFIRSVIRLFQAENNLRKSDNPAADLRVLIIRNKILLLRHPYDLFRLIRLKFFASKIQDIAGNLIFQAIIYFREHGEWHQLQQIGLWRERFHLHEKITLFHNEYITPHSNDGYRQLNFPMGKMMAFRHGIKLRNRLLSDDEISQARNLISEAKVLGITPEIWKLSQLIFQKSLSEKVTNTERKDFLKAFMDCQYSLLFRFWRVILGD